MIAPTLHALWQRLLGHSVGKWFFLSGTSGIFCGIAALAFFWGTEFIFALLVEHVAGLAPARPAGDPALHLGTLPPFNPWWLLVIMALAGLVVAWILRWAPSAAGPGTGVAIDAYHQNAGQLSLRVSVVKFITSIITLGAGGSGGREGPIALICSGINSSFARRLNLSSRDRRLLMAAGIAGGVGAMFQAPLAGALFAAECLYSDSEVESEALIPCFICAIIAYCTFALGQASFMPASDHHLFSSLFNTPEGLGFQAEMVPHLIGFLAVAIAVVLGARLFKITRKLDQGLFPRLAIPLILTPMVGMVTTCALALGAWQALDGLGLLSSDNTMALATLGSGYGFLQQALDNVIAADPMTLCLIFL